MLKYRIRPRCSEPRRKKELFPQSHWPIQAIRGPSFLASNSYRGLNPHLYYVSASHYVERPILPTHQGVLPCPHNATRASNPFNTPAWNDLGRNAFRNNRGKAPFARYGDTDHHQDHHHSCISYQKCHFSVTLEHNSVPPNRYIILQVEYFFL